MDFPQDLRYTKEHEWARLKDGKVIVGITAFAVDQLGDITQVDLPAAGDNVEPGKSIGSIESVKSVSDLYAPVSGKVTRINEELEDRPELVNEAPYGEGWMVEIELAGDDEYEALIARDAYAALVAEAS